MLQLVKENEDPDKMDHFIISGAKIAEGTTTDVNSSYGQILQSLQDDREYTPLQLKLNNTLAKYIARVGGVAALLLFTVLFIRFLARLPHSTQTLLRKLNYF